MSTIPSFKHINQLYNQFITLFTDFVIHRNDIPCTLFYNIVNLIILGLIKLYYKFIIVDPH